MCVRARKMQAYLLVLLFIPLASLQQQQPEYPLNSTQTSDLSLQVDGNSGAVFVAAGRQVYRLDGGLAERDAATLGSEVLNIALSHDGTRLVACLSDFSCVVLNASELSAPPSLVAEGVHGATDAGITLFTAGDGSFYVGSTRVNGMGVQTHILLGRHGGAFNRTVEYLIERDGFMRNFFGGFISGSNAYFLVFDSAPTDPNDLSNVRVMRVCDDGGFNALYERTLFCGASIGSDTDVAGASVIEDFRGTPGSALALGQGRPGGIQNYVCLLTISSDVDAEMDMRYSECVNNRLAGDDIEVAWNAATSNCALTQFQEVDMCSFNSPLGNVDDPVDANQDALRINERNGDFLTASVAVVVDSASFMITAYMRRNTQEYYISVVDFTTYTGSDPLIPSNVAIDTIPVSSQVRQLRWQPGLDYIYALTDTTVVRVPIADCASHTDCSSCLAYDNPLCGWCVVENKCSRMAECQNSATRWLQSTDPTGQCITISITPDDFVSDRPEILSLAVSPGLPALLPSESYSCHLADLQGRFSPILVPAVEVVAGTQYTCNITGQVPSFNGSQAAIAFSFVSSLARVPFDTNRDALAIFDCPAALSCMECLLTQDACGWCNYLKVCSGTDAPCVSSSSYLQLAGAGSFSEVCPLLRPSSAGSYNQPVATATNLRLTTLNLPAPFGGFGYRCTVNGVDLPAVFNNGSSITCVVDQNELQLTSPNSGGIESADVTIRWTGPNALNHTIGALQTGIDVVLYDCSQLADGCSTCLAAIMAPPLDCGWCDPTQGCQFVGASCGSMHITQGASCPAPIITRFTPVSGTTEGGTLITIEGTDLGVVFQDIATILIDGSPCTPVEATYQAGVSVQCETTSGVSSGLIQVTRGGGAVGDSSQEFAVVSPAISGVEPAFGPMAGGSRVRVQGSNLAAGNSVETTVTLEGIDTLDCTVTAISASEINCTTAEFNGSVPQSAAVVVHIDNADISSQGVEFTYRSNPTFTSLSPQNTIPAGGITLSFTGENFDVGSNPVIRITDPGFVTTFNEEPCVVVSPLLLNCTAPVLSMGPDVATNITYTVILDNAPGPVNLPLNVSPDPTNFVLQVTELALGTGTIISIDGDNLASVALSEYRVTVGGQECEVFSLLVCQPPLNPLGGSGQAEVVVFVGGNLQFPLAQQLQYIDSASAVPLAIIIPVVLGGLVAVVLFALLLICCVVCVYRSRLRTVEKRALEHTVTRETIVLTSMHTGNEEDGISDQLKKFIPESLIIPSNQLRLMNTIGQGEFGVVYKAHLTKWHGQGDPHTAAVKTLKGFFTMKDVESLAKEMLKMKDFKHPHVMSLTGVCLDAGAGVSVVMPFMANGSLLDYLKRERETLDLTADTETEKVVEVRKLLLKFCLHIAEGMQYLAEQMFVHRDLAARNCMIDAQGSIKVADFGLSEDVYTAGYFRQGADSAVRLPVKWMAVESLRDGVFTEKSDVWSYGVTMWEVFSVGRLPYPGVQLVSLLQLLEDGHRLARPTNVACSDDIYSMMCKCWYAAQARPSFSELVATLTHHLQAVAGYMELSMVLCQEREEPVAEGNHCYEHVVDGNRAYGLGEPVVEGNQAYGLGEPVVEGNQAYGLGEPVVEGNQAYGLRALLS